MLAGKGELGAAFLSSKLTLRSLVCLQLSLWAVATGRTNYYLQNREACSLEEFKNICLDHQKCFVKCTTSILYHSESYSRTCGGTKKWLYFTLHNIHLVLATWGVQDMAR